MSVTTLHGEATDGPFAITFQPGLSARQHALVVDYLECDYGTREELYDALAEVAEIWRVAVCLRHPKPVLT